MQAKKKENLADFLGDMSPLASNKSVSVGPTSSGMSIDSTTTSKQAARAGQPRAPFGEMQNTFEFKTVGPAAAAASKPSSMPAFTFGAARPAAAAAVTTRAPPQAAAPAASTAAAPLSLRGRRLPAAVAAPAPTAMEQDEPGSPASCSSESRGTLEAGGPPPLTTLNNLSNNFGGRASAGRSAGSDSDTVTPLAPAHRTSRMPLSTPPLVTPPPAPGSSQASRNLVLSDVLLWKEPLQTAAIFAAGLLAFAFLNFAAYGAHRFTLVSGLSYLLLLDLAGNFFRYFVSQEWHDQCLWGDAGQMKHLLTTFNAYALHVAAAHDRLLSADDPFVTLKAAVGLWAAAWAGRFVSLWWCVLLSYVAAFTLPVAYHANRRWLGKVGGAIRARTIDRVDATGLPRTARFVFLAAGVATLWVTSSFAQSAIGFFVALAYWRTLLAPREIDSIRTAAEPYTASALKVGRRISTAASDAFDRMSTAGPKTRTRSHFGAKARME